jgi:aryl-alcohol dehydrogenase-like predicted oxidoreductase
VRYVDLAGTPISVIGLGTWQFGSRAWGYGREYARVDALAITRRALDLGVNLIDTAEIYGFGASERTLGTAIGDRRSAVFVATKLYPLFPIAPLVVRSAQHSAARLGVEQIDLYQLHAPNPIVPLSSTMQGMAELQRSGVVGRVGVSNFSLAEWQQADETLGTAVVSNQVRYSLVAREAERELLGWAHRNDRLVLAYSPLAQGFLSGGYDTDRRPTNLRRKNALFQPAGVTAAADLLRTIRDVARTHGANPPKWRWPG